MRKDRPTREQKKRRKQNEKKKNIIIIKRKRKRRRERKSTPKFFFCVNFWLFQFRGIYFWILICNKYSLVVYLAITFEVSLETPLSSLFLQPHTNIDVTSWLSGRYKPFHLLIIPFPNKHLPNIHVETLVTSWFLASRNELKMPLNPFSLLFLVGDTQYWWIFIFKTHTFGFKIFLESHLFEKKYVHPK